MYHSYGPPMAMVFVLDEREDGGREREYFSFVLCLLDK